MALSEFEVPHLQTGKCVRGSCPISHPEDKVTTSICRAILCPELCWKHYNHYPITGITKTQVGTVFIFTLRMGKLRHRKAKDRVKATWSVSNPGPEGTVMKERCFEGGMKRLEMGQFLALVGTQHITYQVK